jgi:hypothetical protein
MISPDQENHSKAVYIFTLPGHLAYNLANLWLTLLTSAISSHYWSRSITHFQPMVTVSSIWYPPLNHYPQLRTYYDMCCHHAAQTSHRGCWVLGVLIVDCGLLLEHVLPITRGIPSLYRRLCRLVHAYFDHMSTILIIPWWRFYYPIPACAQWLHSRFLSWLSCLCNVVSKHYTPDTNQAINCMISCQI